MKYIISYVTFHENDIKSKLVEADSITSALKMAYTEVTGSVYDWEWDTTKDYDQIKQNAFNVDCLINAIEVVPSLEIPLYKLNNICDFLHNSIGNDTNHTLYPLLELVLSEKLDNKFLSLAKQAVTNGFVSDDNTIKLFKSVVQNNIDFGQALTYLKRGYKIYREGWNGKNMFIILSKLCTEYNPHMIIKNPDGSLSTWAPSGSDTLAEDWRFLIE